MQKYIDIYFQIYIFLIQMNNEVNELQKENDMLKKKCLYK